MKRLVLVTAVLYVLLCPALASSLNFQDATDISSVASIGGTEPLVWSESATGGNNYVLVPPQATFGTYMANAQAASTTYAAATCLSDGGNGVYIRLYDSSKAVIRIMTMSGNSGTPRRYEITVVGGIPYLYRDGILQSTGAAIAANPSYIGFGAGGVANSQWDDFVYGDTENKYIFGNPETDDYILKKDFITPASTGFARADGTVLDSNNMTSTWGKGNITPAGSQTVVLRNVDTQTIYATQYTGTASRGTIAWPLVDTIFNTTAPYGRYEVTIPGSGVISESILYTGSGASISFDSHDYSQQDTATMTYNIDGAYWDTGAYDYRIDIISATTGGVIHTKALSLSAGTDTYTWTEDDAQGVYYAVVIADPASGSGDIWMNYDYAELSAYLTFTGYVNNETGYVQSGANVSIVQNSIVSNSVTIADGNYTATGFLTGTGLTFNITKSGYHQYLVSLTPMVAKTVSLNFTINSTTPAYTGLGIGGIVRDGILTGTTITGGYGRPLSGATVYLKNTTNGEFYTKTTNMAGWYLCDEGTSCFLTTKRPYDVWGEKLSYANSPNYTVVTA